MNVDKLILKKERAKRDGNLTQLVKVTKDLGDMYFEKGKMENALEEYTEQLEMCNTLDDKLNGIVAHRMIGEVNTNLGNYQQALLHQNFYLEGAREIQSLIEEQRALASIGRTYFCLAESLIGETEKRQTALEDARKAYLDSIHRCNELGNQDIELKEIIMMRTRLFLNLGLVLEAEKEHQQAIDLIEKAAVLSKENNLRDDYYRTQIALSGVYERQSNCTLALQHLENAIEIEDTCLKADALFMKAELLLKMERWHESRKVLVSLYVTCELPQNLRCQVERSLRIVVTLLTTEQDLNAEESTSRKLQLYEVLGDAAAAAHCFKKAVYYYREMLSCAEVSKSDRVGAALISLARTLKDAGQYDEALHFARKEFQLCSDPRETCRSALLLADLLIATKAPDQKIRETYALASKNAKSCSDVYLESSVIEEELHYLKNSGNIEEVKTLEAKVLELEQLHVAVDSSSDESEDKDIGGSICLDDLSDVEKELKCKENARMKTRRTNRGSFVIKRNEKGETQLHLACINGNIANVEKLLTANHPTNVRDHFGWTPLHEAANHGHVEIAKLLLKAGAAVDDPGSLRCQGVTPLHDAASCGNFTMMQLLIQHGANVTLKTTDGDSVLDCLEKWRDRVDDLPSSDEAEYNEMVKKLSSILPVRVRKNATQSNEPLTGVRIKTDNEIGTVEKFTPCEDYKKTIASLKHRNDPIKQASNWTSTRCSSALLDHDEDFLEDWLEDDIGVKAKKGNSCVNAVVSTKRKQSCSFERSTKSWKRQKTGTVEDTTIETEELDVTSEESSDSNENERTNFLYQNNPARKKQQVSLLSIGFTKNSSSRSPSPIYSISDDIDNRMETNTLNVSFEGELLQIEVRPLDETKLLMQQILSMVEEKFYRESGCKAKFNLTTKHGVEVQSTNIREILEEGKDIGNLKCQIVEVDIPSIVDRYVTICKTHNAAVREVVLKCLKTCENTSVLRFKQEDMNKEELMIALRALKYQNDVQIFHVSGGELHGAGNALNDCIIRLSTLQELSLRGCDIDTECLSRLEKLPLQLKLLDLSYNPLGSASQELIHKLVAPLKQLRTLNLRYCQLNCFRFPLNNSNVVNLDISWNTIDVDGLSCFLQKQLLSLSLSNTILSNDSNVVLSIVSNSLLTNLESLELACCNLSDIDVESILSRASNLARFVITGNKRIGVKSANLLLGHKPTLKYIDISGCMTIDDYPSSNVFIDNPKICKFIASMIPDISEFWLDLWRGKGILKKLPHNLVIVKPNQSMIN